MLNRKPTPDDPADDDARFLDSDPNDPEEARDLGFIVDEHDDRRIMLTDGWQRLDDLDTDESLDIDPRGRIPHERALRQHGPSSEAFTSDSHRGNTVGEDQEEDFVRTSMLGTDPDGDDDNDPDDAFAGDSRPATDLAGHVAGVAPGFGTTSPQDLGSDGFQIREK